MGIEYNAIIEDFDIKEMVSMSSEKEYALLRYKNAIPIRVDTDTYIQFIKFGIKPVVCKNDDGKYIIL